MRCAREPSIIAAFSLDEKGWWSWPLAVFRVCGSGVRTWVLIAGRAGVNGG